MKNSHYKTIIMFIITFILVISYQSSISAEIFPTNVKLIISRNNDIIDQEEIFEIVDMNEYILVPIVSLSRWIDIDISYIRENDLLSIYYEEENKIVQIDLANKIYYDHPEWSIEPPASIAGDFFVSTKVIEYLTDAKINWLPRKQLLVLNYDEEKQLDSEIKIKPKDFIMQPEINTKDFSIGSIHYKFGFDYKFEGDSSDPALLFNNQTIIHGRASDWTYSIEQELEYDYETKIYELNYPFLNVKNSQNDRLIILGDNQFRLPNTLNRVNLRGIYLQYPLQQISQKRAYTSVKGNSTEGSTVTLFVNDKRIEEEYVYKGENSYYFENVPLTINRTNILRILIKDIDGKETEIVKKVAGSINIFEEGTNQGIFATGKYNKNSDLENYFNVAGLQIKYAPTANTSLLWELGAERITDNLQTNDFNGGSLVRIALRSKDLPLVFYADWLTGNSVDLVEHGVRANTLYTKVDGYINVSYSYVPPNVSDKLEATEGQKIQSIYEKELNENWLMNMQLQNTSSILNMDELNLNIYNISFAYHDKARNKFNITTELANRKEEIKWNKLDLVEQNQKWIDIILNGKTYRGLTSLGGEVNYNLAHIDFQNTINNNYITKRKDYTSLDLNLSRNLSDNITLIGNFNTEFTWIEESSFERNSKFDLKTRFKTSNKTSIIAGISNSDEYNENEVGTITNDNLQELELFLNYNIPKTIKFNVGLKNTYLEDESYLSSELSLDYENQDNDWKLGSELEYIGPYGNRSTAQEKINIEISKYLFSDLEGFFKIERDYESITSEEPFYAASVYFSQSLGFTKDKTNFQKYDKNEHNPYISGLVYLDINRNEQRDINEPLLENINITLDNSSTQTDKEGYYIFENLKKGIHEIGINSKELPTNYRVITENKVINLRENENLFFEFGLTKLGEIRGQVLIAENNSKKEISLNHIGFKIKELDRIVFTNSEGKFNFNYIPLGSYTIEVMQSSLPKGLTILGENSYEINITSENLINKDININLISKN